jgi:hypothetical protein
LELGHARARGEVMHANDNELLRSMKNDLHACQLALGQSKEMMLEEIRDKLERIKQVRNDFVR